MQAATWIICNELLKAQNMPQIKFFVDILSETLEY